MADAVLLQIILGLLGGFFLLAVAVGTYFCKILTDQAGVLRSMARDLNRVMGKLGMGE